MRRFSVLTISLSLLAPALAAAPAPAGAATSHVVRGAGFGHGIGMSQFGAYGYAKNGRSYRDILAHYYKGTELSRADQRPIRVLLRNGRESASFTGATDAGGHALDPAETYKAKPYGTLGVEIARASDDKLVERFPGPVAATSSGAPVRLTGTALNGLSGGRYRGSIEFRPNVFGGITAVNALSLDDYVQGVVPGEVPSSWPAEVLKAQAVAARSYALTTDAGGELFDQYPDTRSQVYRGVDHETLTTNAAVQATANEVLRYGGKIAVTYFFSTSGGRTENVENVFYGATPSPYLVSVDDPFDNASPRHRWRLTFTARKMRSKLRGLVKGRLRRIKVVERGSSPRVVWAHIKGSRGTTRVRGATLRARLGLYDTWAYFSTVRTEQRNGPAPVPKADPPKTDAPATSSPTGGVRASRRLVALGRLPRYIAGQITPRPTGGVIAVERRDGSGAWRKVRRLRTSRRGTYQFTVDAAGVYRVRAGAIAGPALTVR